MAASSARTKSAMRLESDGRNKREIVWQFAIVFAMAISIFASALVQNQTICVPEAFNIPDSEGAKVMAVNSEQKKM